MNFNQEELMKEFLERNLKILKGLGKKMVLGKLLKIKKVRKNLLMF
jgi:hypothetical protein